MSIQLTGSWEKIKRYIHGEWKSKAKSVALKRVATFYERQVKQNILTSGALTGKPFALLAESTIRRKGASKPLIDTGEMLNSIQSEQIDDNTAFVGIKAGTRHGGGKEDTADIAAVHEFGALIPGGEIPARPFIRPVIADEKIRAEAIEIMTRAFKDAEDAL